ncbi:G10 protein-domain-containing protein [Sphaerosporella brunnea]|uniref:G10 protein-domain-containing protein n=1 Tax=Sphaerosporella brunnea TaxID=1250544 RepID=A0A5J5F1R7_9PEZI|nr:G10 protein-domain-containing protein [Sphaerosporella brunnea]
MPPIRHTRGSKKPPPEGFDEIEDTLLDFANKMKDAESAPHEGKKKNEATWDIFRISHQRNLPLPFSSLPSFPFAKTLKLRKMTGRVGSRYVYELYYKKEAISKQLYDWLLKNNYADANLIAKWKKQGYEKLCCMRCIQAKEHNFNTTCICRVPRARLNEESSGIQCTHCGCRGCASSD